MLSIYREAHFLYLNVDFVELRMRIKHMMGRWMFGRRIRRRIGIRWRIGMRWRIGIRMLFPAAM